MESFNERFGLILITRKIYKIFRPGLCLAPDRALQWSYYMRGSKLLLCLGEIILKLLAARAFDKNGFQG
jgi:hypothetical protein